jgi:hypothetical protein
MYSFIVYVNHVGCVMYEYIDKSNVLAVSDSSLWSSTLSMIFILDFYWYNISVTVHCLTQNTKQAHNLSIWPTGYLYIATVIILIFSFQNSIPATSVIYSILSSAIQSKALICTILFDTQSTVAYRPVAKQWLYKQQLLLGNARRLYACNNRVILGNGVFSMWSAPRPFLGNSSVNTFPQQQIRKQQ